MSSDLLAAPAAAGSTIGAGLIAEALKHAGVNFMFGVVGIPIIEIGTAAQHAGIQFVGFRNEQAASYAAGAASYLTGQPQACLCVSGPGVVHGAAGLANAWANCWPMVLIGGAPATSSHAMGGFQEANTLEVCRPFTKFQARIDSIQRIPFYVARAIHVARSGRPGPVYLEVPADVIADQIRLEEIPALLGRPLPPPPRAMADMQSVKDALSLLRSAQRPLVIVGKGCAWARAEEQVGALVQHLQLPFIATPMGKGVVPDDHPLCVQAARSTALAQADVILLLGARLNWMLHFGLPPRFATDVKIIQADVAPEEMHTNVTAAVAIVGDLKETVGQLIAAAADDTGASSVAAAAAASRSSSFPSWSGWKATLSSSVQKNNATVARLQTNEEVPMSYYRVFKSIAAGIPKNSIIVSEGANTMDIGRTLLLNHLPRHRLDAGTFGTMGVGPGFAIAAAVVAAQQSPGKRVICVEGDSAFGFSGMEFEVAARYRLPIVFIVVNNSGIYAGLESGALPSDRFSPDLPVTALTPAARYEKLADVVGGPAAGSKGYLIHTPAELDAALQDALQQQGPTILNVIIRTVQARKQQAHGWLTTTKKAQSKL